MFKCNKGQASFEMITIIGAIFVIIIWVFAVALPENEKTIVVAIAKEKTLAEIQKSRQNLYIKSITMSKDNSGINIIIDTEPYPINNNELANEIKNALPQNYINTNIIFQ